MNRHFEMLESFYRLRTLHFAKLLPEGITHGEIITLLKLRQLSVKQSPQKVTVSELNGLLDVSAPALSRTLKHLEESGYVNREPDKNDRRNNFLTLTEKGQSIIANVEHEMSDFWTVIVDKMGENRTADFLQFLDDLYTITSEEINKKNPQKE